MTLTEIKNKLFRASYEFARKIQPVYVSFDHRILTKRGLKVPSVEDLDALIIDLINRLEEGTISYETAGIRIDLEVDEDDNSLYLDASLAYICSVICLLEEEDVESDTENSL